MNTVAPISVTVLSPTQIRIVADGVADATINVPNADRAAQIAREEFDLGDAIAERAA